METEVEALPGQLEDAQMQLEGTEMQPEGTETHLVQSWQGEPFVGHIKGIVIGQTWPKRRDVSKSGVHRPIYAGIWGGKNCAKSIVVSGGYDDDIDSGETIYYTGAGGRSKNTGPFGGNTPQTEDQSFTHHSNAALQKSYVRRLPVRVIRGLYDSEANLYYRYDGLYDVTSAELVDGRGGHKVCWFRFQRRQDQDPLPHIGPPDAIPARPENKPKIRRRRS